MDAITRKHQNTLVIIGAGVIAFGVWSLIKSVIRLIFGESKPEGFEAIPLGVTALFYIIVIVAFSFDLLFRLYIGRKAMAAGRGKKVGITYLLGAVILALAYAFGIVAEVAILISEGKDIIDQLVVIFIDITSLVLLLELIYSGLWLRRAEKRKAIAKTAEDKKG